MTMIPCMVCGGDGTVEQGNNCGTCGGSGEIEATFGITEGHRMAMFNMVIELTTNIATASDERADILDKLNDVLDKLNDVLEKLAD